MSQIPEALKKDAVKRGRAEWSPTEKGSLQGILPADLSSLADDIQVDAQLKSSRPHWDLQSSILSLGRSKDHAAAREELSKLAAWLLGRRAATPQRTYLVTSSLPEEGKTFVVVNLAWIMAQAKRHRVLLIDADLRCPNAHRMLGAPSAPGLSEFLAEKANENQILQQGPLARLFFIPAGRSPQNPMELLTSAAMGKLFARLSHSFDWIFLDCPPALSGPDAHLIASFVDGVLLVVGAGKSSREATAKTRDLFADKGLVGAVLNNSDARHSYSPYRFGTKRQEGLMKKG